MTSRKLIAASLFVASLGWSTALRAQEPKAVTLDEILQRLETNLQDYDAKVPSFLCDEHIVSRRQSREGTENSVIESAFRLKRTGRADHTTTLVESRDLKTVDGKPAASADIDGPTLLDGAFEGGLAVVSLSQRVCTNYTLQRVHVGRPAEAYVVRFATVITPENSSHCLLEEDSKGSVTIDPVTMQIQHLEMTTPRHVILAAGAGEPAVVGKRIISVEYAPVDLGGRTFWMPSTIALQATGGAGSFHETVWSYRASYCNFHKLEVTSRILP